MKKAEEQNLAEFLKSARIVISVTPASSGRELRKLFLKIGALPNQVIATENFEEAKKEVSSSPTHIFIVEMDFGEKSGLDLIEYQEKNFKNRSEIATIVVTSGPSNASIGMMAEANVDAVLLRPLTFDNFKQAVDQALENKMSPSPYWRLLEEAKVFFNSNQFEKAVPIFEESKSKHPKPTLAFYYLGLIHRTKNEISETIRCFEEGLRLDPKDYRCLIGMLDTRIQRLEWDEAYKAATRFHADYPVSLKRIPGLVRLSVHCGKYPDILDYYKIFKDIEKRDPMLCRVVVAGMLICAKFLFKKPDALASLKVLKDAAKISSECGTLQADVLRYFVQLGYYLEGMEFLPKIPQDLRRKPEIRLLCLELYSLAGQDELVLQEGAELLKLEIKTEKVYQLLTSSSQKLNRSDESIVQLLRENSQVPQVDQSTAEKVGWFKGLLKR